MLPPKHGRAGANQQEALQWKKLTYSPAFISTFFKRMPHFFRGKHQLIFIWFILIIAFGAGDYKLTTMACYGSGFVTEWRFRRLLSASYWDMRAIFMWLLSENIRVLPIPEDKTLYVIVDGSKKEKCSKKNFHLRVILLALESFLTPISTI
jgi:hypothetical protein